MFYFGSEQVYSGELDKKALENLIKVSEFKERVSSLGGLYFPYKEIASFREDLRTHLAINQYGRSWGSTENEESVINLSLEEIEPTIIDLAADAEEAMETETASLSRMTTAMKTMGDKMLERTAEAKKLARLGGVSPKRARGVMRAAADDINALRKVFQDEIPVFKGSWQTYKDSLNTIITLTSVTSEEDRVSIEGLSILNSVTGDCLSQCCSSKL